MRGYKRGQVLDESVKTFRGKNVAEAMSKVRAELGCDAFVLEKREIRGKKSLFKLGGEELVEIVATNSSEVVRQVEANKPRAPRGRTLLEKTYDITPVSTANCPPLPDEPQVSVELNSNRRRAPVADSAAKPLGAGKASTFAVTGASSSGADKAGASDIELMLSTMRSEILRMTSIQARGGIPAVGERLLDAYQMLIENEVNPEIARSLVEELQQDLGQGALDGQTVCAMLCLAVGRQLRICGATQPARKADAPAVIAVVGPSGAGKTTTVVKMAFEFAYNRKLKVGIINEDFRRPGANAQLQGLMSILDLPLVTADNPAGLANELRNMAELDVVLIDTAGRGPRDRKGLAELSQVLAAARSDEVHLAINAASTERSALACVQAYATCGFDRLILSKLDEAPAYGLALNLARTVRQEMSYITTGQKWTAGLQAADAQVLARLICGVDLPLE